MTERFINFNLGSTWSHDGEYLAYYSFLQVSADTRHAESWWFDRPGLAKNARCRSRPGCRRAFEAGPKWFPDNRSVLVEVGDADGPGFGFYRFAIDTGNTELLARLPREVSSYDLSLGRQDDLLRAERGGWTEGDAFRHRTDAKRQN